MHLGAVGRGEAPTRAGVGQVGVELDLEAVLAQRERGLAHGEMVGVRLAQPLDGAAGHRRDRPRGKHQRASGKTLAQGIRERRRRLGIGAVLAVEEVEVDRLAPGEREGGAVLHAARLDHRPPVPVAAQPVPPADGGAGRRHAGKDVDDRHLAGAREHVPARKDGVVEVGRQDRDHGREHARRAWRQRESGAKLRRARRAWPRCGRS
jgi:hypothetical protein